MIRNSAFQQYSKYFCLFFVSKKGDKINLKALNFYLTSYVRHEKSINKISMRVQLGEL
jgi:hypothetical protein